MSFKDYTLFDDSPIEKAHDFNFDRIVSVLFKFLTNNRITTPLSICIDGDWGSGKTSLMRTLQSRLEKITSNNKNKSTTLQLIHIPIWFEPWKLKDETDVLDSLIGIILNKIQDDASFQTSAQIELDRKDVIRVLSQRILNINPDELSSYYQSSSRNKESFTEIEHLFHKIAKSYLNSSGRKKCFTIFVDDLDRCPPQRIISVLETIKLFLNMPGFIFIFAMDKTRIENAVLDTYKSFTKEDSQVYLEKIFQLIYSLPIKEEDDLISFISKAMKEMGLIINNQSMLKTIIDITGKNIRNIKLFLNSFNFHRNLLGKVSGELNDELLLKWLCLETILPNSMSTTLEQKSVGLPIALEYLARGAVLDDPKLYNKYRLFLSNQPLQYIVLVVWAVLPQISTFEELDDNRLKLDELHVVNAIRNDKKILQALKILNTGKEFFINQDLSKLAFLTQNKKPFPQNIIFTTEQNDTNLISFDTNFILPKNNWRLLGTKFINRLDYRSAYFCYLLALIKDFSLPWNWGYIGSIYLQYGYLDVARSLYRKAYEIDPSNNTAYTRTAYYYYNIEKDYRLASLLFRKTLSLGETSSVQSDLAQSLKYLRDDKRAFLYALEAYQIQHDDFRRLLAVKYAIDIGKTDLQFNGWNKGLAKEIEQGRTEGIHPFRLQENEEKEVKLLFLGFPQLDKVSERLRRLPMEV
jgi:hypothetical protein